MGCDGWIPLDEIGFTFVICYKCSKDLNSGDHTACAVDGLVPVQFDTPEGWIDR